MYSKIKNTALLENKGDAFARKKVLSMTEKVLRAMDARNRIREIMSLEGNILTVGKEKWDLDTVGNIYLFGAGKAANHMAMSVCDILGDRLTHGIVCVKIAEPDDTYVHTDIYVGGHPLPNEEGMKAAKAIIEMIENADKNDLFISVFSGGSSALLTYPVEGITLQDEILAQELLLKSGANILEINAVRRHISRTNGGKLSRMIHEKGARLISLMISDAVGKEKTYDRSVPAEFWGTMVAPDQTTVEDARNTIRNYDLTDVFPRSILEYLMDDSRAEETPKEQYPEVLTYVLDRVPDSCEEAVKIAGQENTPIMVLSTLIEGESREIGMCMSSICREIRLHGRPIQPPCYLVFSGEATTTVDMKCKGKGGPSQELVLGFAKGISGYPGIAIVSIDSEGTDGVTGNAGGIADSQTCSEIEKHGESIHAVLREHNAGAALESMNDNIVTGNTGTNVCDFNVIYIDKK